jgi:hypothetical protein
MSSTEKTLLWVGAALIVVGGVWWLVAGKNPQAPAYNSAMATTTTPAETTGSAATAPSDTSDGAINSDISAMGTQMDGLSTDSAQVDASMSDKPITQ